MNTIAVDKVDAPSGRRCPFSIIKAGKHVFCMQGSAASAADNEKCFAEMDRRWGGVDVAHANAGMAMNKPALDLTEEEWRRTLDLNLTGVFLTAKAAGRSLVDGRTGLFVGRRDIDVMCAAAKGAAYTGN